MIDAEAEVSASEDKGASRQSGKGSRESGLARFVVPLVFLVYLAILSLTALPQGLETEFGFGKSLSFTPMTSNQEMRDSLGQSDAGSYARGGAEMAEEGWIETPGFLTLWPPGMFLLHAAAILLVGPDGPALLVLVAANVLAWAFVMTMLFAFARARVSLPLALAAPLAFLVFPFFRDYLLGWGVLMSEGLSMALWSMAVLIMVHGLRARSWKMAVGAGAALAAGSYVRTQVYAVGTLGLAAALGLVALAFALWYFRRRYRGEGRPFRAFVAGRGLGYLLVVAISFQAFMAPYLLNNLFKHGRYDMAFADYYFRYHWTLPKDYSPVAGFVLRGGGPVACHVDPETCAEMAELLVEKGRPLAPRKYRRKSMEAFFRNPISWFAYRLEHLPSYWFSSPSITTPREPDYFAGTLLAGVALIGLVLLVPLAASPYLVVLVFNLLCLYGATAAVFVVMHYEVRYLYHFQFGTVLLALLALILVVGRWRDKPAAGLGAAPGGT